ncbi:MAG: transposase [Verrucomicrobia bacterium]|nr:transposase [Verrucomicrobiota bacterium]
MARTHAVTRGQGAVEIDNNLVENAVRPTKLGAKNHLSLTRSVEGSSLPSATS